MTNGVERCGLLAMMSRQAAAQGITLEAEWSPLMQDLTIVRLRSFSTTFLQILAILRRWGLDRSVEIRVVSMTARVYAGN